MKVTDIKPEVFAMAQRVQAKLGERFAEIDAVAEENTRRVMTAFQDNRVSDACFAGTTGYGYDDLGRETLDKIYAQIFGAEAALVRIGFVNGTHALTTAMFALVKPGDTILAVTGTPYDTLRSAIGISGDCHGSLKFYGVNYAQVDLNADGDPDIPAIKAAAADKNVTAVMIQRSRGYAERKALTVQEIGEIIKAVKEVNPAANVMVDNCYGEFVETIEPSDVGADMVVGSLIKNPGGGLAPIGGYICGKKEYIENCAYRLTTPGLGKEVGASLNATRPIAQGLFLAPTVTAAALKGAIFAANVYERLHFKSVPNATEPRYDIIQAVEFGKPEYIQAFCEGIQAAAPVDSFVTPIPWDMPGYDSQVIMAAGAFVSGASIELSADAPMKEPYAVYFQGGLTYPHAKFGIMMSLEKMVEKGLVVC